MIDKRRLTEFVPVRVSRVQKIALRKWARMARADVSDVVRDLIDERMRRQSEASGATSDVVGVAA